MSYSTIAASRHWPTWEVWLPMAFGLAFGVGVASAVFFVSHPPRRIAKSVTLWCRRSSAPGTRLSYSGQISWCES